MTKRVPPKGLGGPFQAIRGIVFIVLMYLWLLVMGLICLIPSWLSRDWALVCIKGYCDSVLWLLRVLVGTRVEIRGTPPQQTCIVASKHQAFLDILILVRALPRPAFVMKKSLRWAPVLGVYAERLGSIAIDRSAGGGAMKAMIEGANQQAAGRQIIVFAQGTRVPPEVDAPYRPGVLKLRAQTGLPITLAALNTGWFWPRTGLRRTPGTAILEFIGEVPPGEPLEVDALAGPIEEASDRLAAEAAASIAR